MATGELVRSLVRTMTANGSLTDPAWRAAFQAVPRELFVPSYYTTGPDGRTERRWRDDPDPQRRERWLRGAYEDAPVATRMRDGLLISSEDA